MSTNGTAGRGGVGAVGVSRSTVKATTTHLGPGSLSAAERTTHRAGLALETVIALLTASEDTALVLEIAHANGRESRGGVVLGGIVVHLVNGDSRVNDVRLNGLLVDDWLDGLMDVVVYVLTSHDWSDGAGVLALNALLLITELSLLGSKTLLHLVGIVVLERAVLDRDDVVVVLLRKDGLVDYWLHGSVVVVLVDFLVDSGLHILMLDAVDGLMSDGGSDFLVDSGVVVARLRHEVLNCGFGGVHSDCVGSVFVEVVGLWC